jgi:hypothetical protein
VKFHKEDDYAVVEVGRASLRAIDAVIAMSDALRTADAELTRLRAEVEGLEARLVEAERERNENAVALVRAAKEADERYQHLCRTLAERNDAVLRAELTEQDAARYREMLIAALTGLGFAHVEDYWLNRTPEVVRSFCEVMARLAKRAADSVEVKP